MAFSRQEDLKEFTHYIDNDETNDGMLILDEKNITDEIILKIVMPYLAARPNIKKVSLVNNLITNNGAVILSGIGSLRELFLGGNHIGSVGAVALSHHKKLESLTLDDNAICDGGLVDFKDNRVIKSLCINRCMITDAGMIHLATNRSITFLSLSGNKITTAGVEVLNVNPVIERRFIDGFPVTANAQEAVSDAEIIDEMHELRRLLYPEDNNANSELAKAAIMMPAVEERSAEEVVAADVKAEQSAQNLSADEETATVATIVSPVEPAIPQAILAEIVAGDESVSRDEIAQDAATVLEESVERVERVPSPDLPMATAVLCDSLSDEYMAVIADVELAGAPGALPVFFPSSQELALLMRPQTPVSAPVQQPASHTPTLSRQDALTMMYADSVKEIIPKYESAAEMYKELALLSMQEYARYLQSITLSYLQDKLIGKSAFNVAIKLEEQYRGTSDETAKRILLSYLVLYMKQLAKRESANSSTFGWMAGKPNKTSKQNAATKCYELLSGDDNLATIDAKLDEAKEHERALNDSSLMGMSEGDLSVFRKQIKWAMEPKNREIHQVKLSPRK